MVIHLKILSWALIFILRLRFLPGKSIAKLNKLFNDIYAFVNCNNERMAVIFRQIYSNLNWSPLPEGIFTKKMGENVTELLTMH